MRQARAYTLLVIVSHWWEDQSRGLNILEINCVLGEGEKEAKSFCS
jgi:hypothetical protein